MQDVQGKTPATQNLGFQYIDNASIKRTIDIIDEIIEGKINFVHANNKYSTSSQQEV